MVTNDRETGEKGGDVPLLRDLKGFRVEWEDGVTGIADGVVRAAHHRPDVRALDGLCPASASAFVPRPPPPRVSGKPTPGR
jgi:hypothetical protein